MVAERNVKYLNCRLYFIGTFEYLIFILQHLIDLYITYYLYNICLHITTSDLYITTLSFLYLVLVWGPPLAVLRVYYWFCAQELLLAVVRKPHQLLKIIPGSAAHITATVIVSLAPDHSLVDPQG